MRVRTYFVVKESQTLFVHRTSYITTHNGTKWKGSLVVMIEVPPNLQLYSALQSFKAHSSCWAHSAIVRHLCWQKVLTRWGMDRRTLGFPEVSGMGVLAVVPLGPVDGASADWTCSSTSRRSWSDFDLGNSEAKSTHWALRHVPGCFLRCGRVEGSLLGLWQCLDGRYPMNARAQGCPVDHCMSYTSPLMSWLTVCIHLSGGKCVFVYAEIFANIFTISAQTVMNCQCRVLYLFQLPPGVQKISYSSSTPKNLKLTTCHNMIGQAIRRYPMRVEIRRTTRLLEGKQTKLL